MKKVEKGAFGYIHSQKIRRSVFTGILFFIPLSIYIAGLITQGTRLTMFTFVAIMLCLPACRCAVGLIMMAAQKSISKESYEKTEQAAAGRLIRLYELVFTAYEKITPVDCIVLGPGCVIGYTSSPKADLSYIEKHLSEILERNNARRTVKIFKDYDRFHTRVREMAESEEASESIRRNEKAKDILLSIAL